MVAINLEAVWAMFCIAWKQLILQAWVLDELAQIYLFCCNKYNQLKPCDVIEKTTGSLRSAWSCCNSWVRRRISTSAWRELSLLPSMKTKISKREFCFSCSVALRKRTQTQDVETSGDSISKYLVWGSLRKPFQFMKLELRLLPKQCLTNNLTFNGY